VEPVPLTPIHREANVPERLPMPDEQLTVTIPAQELFAAGTHGSDVYTEADLDAMARAATVG
jgi:hypothetical protein